MKVAVLQGGRSGEHDISLASARAVEGALTSLGYEPWPLVFGRLGGARWPGGAGSFAQALLALEATEVDCAVIAMHGADGEDGRIQAALELCEVAYQGSRVTSSAVALDKARTKTVYRAVGLPVAEDVVVAAGDDPAWSALAEQIGLPCVLKTAESGSSVGIEIIDSETQLAERGAALLATGTDSLMVERYVTGREFTVAVLEDLDGSLRALPPVEIRPVVARFFDYTAKYTPGATDEICPAPIDDDLADHFAALGIAAHRALGCRHYSRTDVILCEDTQTSVLLETNTLPGLTPLSLFPKAAVAAGMSFAELVRRLVDLALRERASPRPFDGGG